MYERCLSHKHSSSQRLAELQQQDMAGASCFDKSIFYALKNVIIIGGPTSFVFWARKSFYIEKNYDKGTQDSFISSFLLIFVQDKNRKEKLVRPRSRKDRKKSRYLCAKKGTSFFVVLYRFLNTSFFFECGDKKLLWFLIESSRGMPNGGF